MVTEYTALARTLRDHFIRLLNQYGLLLADCLTTPEMFSVPVPNSGVEASPGSPANSDASQSSEVLGMRCLLLISFSRIWKPTLCVWKTEVDLLSFTCVTEI